MLIFMWAGQANTPPGLFWALYYILKHPHVRQKIMEEFKDLLKAKRQEADPDEANNNMPEQNVSLDDILNLEKEDLDKLILLSMFCDNHTVKPRLSNAFVLDQIGFRPKNYVRLRTQIRVTTKPKEAEGTQRRHDAAYVGFFHTIFGLTELLYFFLLFH